MSLIKCPECGADVSDKAEKCPKCAHPISQDKTQVIEKTSKELKKKLLIGVIMILIGFIALVYNTIAGVVILTLGVIYVIATKISIWWKHE